MKLLGYLTLIAMVMVMVMVAGGAGARPLSPFNIGHRGASGSAPENTMPAFQLAISQGANGFETDLRTTSDGVIVLIHDDTVDRTTNCSSTAPVGQCRCGPVNALTLAALRTCDAGSWFGAEFAGTQVPTFEEAVAFARSVNASIVMDLKTNDQTQGLLGQQILPIVQKYDMETDVIASCWNDGQINNAAQYLKSSPRQFLGSQPRSDFGNEYFRKLLSMGVTGFSLNGATLTSEFVYLAHKRLLPVYVWYVRSNVCVFVRAFGRSLDRPQDCQRAICNAAAGGRWCRWHPHQLPGDLAGCDRRQGRRQGAVSENANANARVHHAKTIILLVGGQTRARGAHAT